MDAEWNLIDEAADDTEDIWWILEGQDYPRLWWELAPENSFTPKSFAIPGAFAGR